jgi:hypothetical protein
MTDELPREVATTEADRPHEFAADNNGKCELCEGREDDARHAVWQANKEYGREVAADERLTWEIGS